MKKGGRGGWKKFEIGIKKEGLKIGMVDVLLKGGDWRRRGFLWGR